MDSVNSGSIQSSSGGSEEYDSRAADSISAFFNHPFSTQPLPPATPMFDPLSYFDHPLSRSTDHFPNSVSNLDILWSKNLRSEPNCTDLGKFMTTAPSSPPPPTQQLLNNQKQVENRTTLPCMQISQVAEIDQPNQPTTNNNSNNSNNNILSRNPKKRSRASRRAPTTVLTTDTSNFRAMVQEFTGIPAPPFAGSSPFTRPRLDLFGSTSPHYLLRPFPQKIHSTPTTNVTTFSSTSELGFLKQPQNDILNTNMQNPIFNFQTGSTKPQRSVNDSPLKMGVFEDLVSSHGNANTSIRDIVSSNGGALVRDGNGTNHWGQHDQSVVRSINGGYGEGFGRESG